MKKSLCLAFFISFFASLACNVSGFLPANGASADANLLFQDDFSSIITGWDSVRDGQSITDYENGGYRIWVNRTNFNHWATPGLGDKLPGDVRVEVDASKISGPDLNSFGIICRHTSKNDLSNFYYLAVSSNGYAGIFKMTDGNETLLTAGTDMLQSNAVNKGGTMNHIRADCIGSTLTLYVNGQQVDSVTDSSFASGDVGLIAGSYKEPGVDILFDNFKVTKP